MTERAYRAACPGCGAPVEFRGAQSAYAVCSYCQSTVVRQGDTLSRIGKMAELFEDHSPLQLQARGSIDSRAFTLVGRLQYKSGSGNWTEWVALFDDGSTALLAEDNGAYVFARQGSVRRALPEASQFRIGATTAVEGKSFQVTLNEETSLVSAQGELPRLPPLNQSFPMVELRSADAEVLSIDFGAQPPQVTRGRAVTLDELRMSGLKEESAKEETGRQFACPNCGAPVAPKLSLSRSIVCASCNSVIDLRQGIGGELAHAEQHEPVRPLIALGSTGQLQGAQWQVVGYQHRMGWEPGEDDERFGWDEYLLYNRKRGFIFLVDATDGWSVVKPTTGAPKLSDSAQEATYLGKTYTLQYGYHAETNYVSGEFYWPVERGQKSFNRDFASGNALLSMEETPREQTWSAGSKIASEAVAKAFGLEDKRDLLKRGDAGPVTAAGNGVGCGCATILIILFVVLVLVVLVKSCEDDSRTGGGVYRGSTGGFSSGGSHK
ncbi:DUF4178 domain-containing protein [Ramlibacter sp.]|uniref:DUF4178 domain-containing protein n=1 Tax=Ramlibacter sp. TaxID=1917967 RepID=UPI003D0EAD7C